MKPNLRGVQKGKLTRAFNALRAQPGRADNPLREGPLKQPVPPWTAIYRTEDGAHGVIIINTDEGGPDAEAGPRPRLGVAV
jgi:hypothetical protein